MKIAIIVDSLAVGGAERQAVLAAVALSGRSERVEIVTYHARNDFKDIIAESGVKWVLVEDKKPLRMRRIHTLAQYLRQGDFSIVHCFHSIPSTYGRLAAKLAGVPVIFGGVRGEISDGFLIRNVNRLLTLGTAGWIVNSDRNKDVAVREFRARGERVFVVPNGIRPEEFASDLTVEQARVKFGLPQDFSVVTMIANLRPEKNHAMFFRIVQRLVQVDRKRIFLLAGSGPKMEDAQELCRQMKLLRYVRFLGQVKDIPSLLRATDVVVLTSWTEGLPNALLEASCAGIPSVSTDHGGSRAVIVDGETGFIVPKNDDESMAEKVSLLLGGFNVKNHMGNAAREMVAKRFSLQALGDNLMRVYRLAMEEAGIA